jgi:predicted metal-dependent phosphoesterase TrpH
VTRRGLIHAHSARSFDSLLPPWAYLAYAHRHHLDFLCLTDHNTIAGSLEIARANRDPGLEVVVGAEYATDRGDVIGLFLEEEISSRTWADVVAAIRRQGGLVLMPHPFRNHRLDDAIWDDVDMVEVFNARSTPEANAAALEQATARGKPQFAGSDGHTAWELLRAPCLVTLEGDGELRDLLLTAPRSLETRLSSPRLTWYSQKVKRVRRRLGRPGVR